MGKVEHMRKKKPEKNEMCEHKTIALIIPYIGGGGAERVAADLSIYFSSKGYHVIFFVQHRMSGVMVYPHEGKEVPVPMTYGYRKEGGPKTFALLYKEAGILRKLKREYRIDVSISFMPECNMLNLLSRCHDRVIVTLHNVVSKRKEIPVSICNNKWVYRYLYQTADTIVLVSKYCQRDWIKHYGDALHKTRLIYNPVRKLKDTGEDLKDYGKNLVLFLARLEGIKRPWHIIRMFSRVLEQIPDAKLLMLGDGILLSSMKALSNAMGMENSIVFAGRVGNVEDYLRAAKVSVLASASEAFPCSVIEAMKCGVPVVANDCPGGIREALGIKKQSPGNIIRQADCGLITPYLDGKKYSAAEELSIEEKYMADAVIRLLTEDSLYNSCSQNCKQRAKKFDLERIGFLWEELIW